MVTKIGRARRLTNPRNLVDYRCMRRVGTLLDDFHKEISKTLRIHQAWSEIAGEVHHRASRDAEQKSGHAGGVMSLPPQSMKMLSPVHSAT